MTHVVDASAVLAVILDEPGADAVIRSDRLLHLSMVNLGEVFTRIVQRGGSLEDAQAFLQSARIRVRAFREPDAIEAAALWPLTRSLGLSFGDRACLALARRAGLPVLTADRKWAELDIGLDIRLIR